MLHCACSGCARRACCWRDSTRASQNWASVGHGAQRVPLTMQHEQPARLDFAAKTAALQGRQQTAAQPPCMLTAQWLSIRQHERTVIVTLVLKAHVDGDSQVRVNLIVFVVSLVHPHGLAQHLASQTEAAAARASMLSTVAGFAAWGQHDRPRWLRSRAFLGCTSLRHALPWIPMLPALHALPDSNICRPKGLAGRRVRCHAWPRNMPPPVRCTPPRPLQCPCTAAHQWTRACGDRSITMAVKFGILTHPRSSVTSQQSADHCSKDPGRERSAACL